MAVMLPTVRLPCFVFALVTDPRSHPTVYEIEVLCPCGPFESVGGAEKESDTMLQVSRRSPDWIS